MKLDTGNMEIDTSPALAHTAVCVLATLHIGCVLKLNLLQADSTCHVIWAVAVFCVETGL